MTDDTALTPAQIASLKSQLKAANARLLAVERRRAELQAYIANWPISSSAPKSGGDA